MSETPGHDEEDIVSQEPVLPPGKTLLPAPVASLVTTFTQTASFGLRVGSKIGGFAIAGARETTLTSLEITRAAIEAVLTRAGRDVSDRRTLDLGRAEAENILERTISTLHSTIASISFFASSGFYLSTAVLTSTSTLSVQGLSTLNAVLGSTESSRAVAAIIELIKDEFKKPEPGKEHEFVGYFDLFGGIVGFVLLQRWGRRKTEQEFRENGGEEIIWDAVIDDKGFRADVVGTQRTTYFETGHPPAASLRPGGRPVSFLSPAGDEAIEAIERATTADAPHISLSPGDHSRLSDEEIRVHIMSQLPDGCHAAIVSETFTAKTIRVDLYDADITEVTPPPGTVMVREHVHHKDNSDHGVGQDMPSQTVVFRTALRRSSSAEVEPTSKLTLTSPNLGGPETGEDSDDGVVMRNNRSSRQAGQSRSIRPHEAHSVSNLASDSDSADELHDVGWDNAPSTVPSRIAVANQKRPRRPVASKTAGSGATRSTNPLPLATDSGSDPASAAAEKKKKAGPLRQALKSLSPSTSSTRIKRNTSTTRDMMDSPRHFPLQIPQVTPFSQALYNKPLPKSPTLSIDPEAGGRAFFNQRASQSAGSPGYHSIREKRHHDTLVHETETYSTHSYESRPSSPTLARTHSRTMSGLSSTRSGRDIRICSPNGRAGSRSGEARHRRNPSLMSGLYSMAGNGSETSLILAPKGPMPRPSIYDDHEVLSALAAEGKVPGIFPNDHLVRNVRRYVRFASASYGSQFLRFMGLTAPSDHLKESSEPRPDDFQQQQQHHHEHTSFSQYTGLPPDTILLSSFEDPHGGMGLSQSPSSALPLVHFISIDRDSKAVVLTCRGTLGFEDVLTDMLCDFDDMHWRGKSYQVHKGIHASARRMLRGREGRCIATLKAALEEYPDFGLVLTGHSLGGAVASLLAILISEPSTVDESGTLFATASPQRLIAHPEYEQGSASPPVTLPSGRPIHVYAYGPPATMSPSLRIATRGLITTIVNSNDIVPSLSLGILHDFRTVALSLKQDTTGAIAGLKSRVWDRVRYAAQSAFYVDSGVPPPAENRAGDGLGEDTWAWAALKTLRAGMCSNKLVPPGEVFLVETTRVFDRQEGTFLAGGGGGGGAVAADTATERVFRSLGRPATRVQMKLVRDVETRLGELRFGSRMFSDHSPARYEATLAALATAILEN